MRRASIPIVLCALIAAVPLTGCSKVKARAELKKGNQYYKEEAYKDALAQFQKGLQLDPKATFAWRSVGLTAMALYRPGDPAKDNLKYADLAVDAFQKYLKDHPQDSKVEEYLTGIWVASEQYDKALKFLKEQRREHAGDSKFDQAIVSVLIKAMRFDQALDWVNSNARKDANLYYTIGTQAWQKSYTDPTITLDERISAVDIGLDAMDHAVNVKPDYMEAMVYYNLLYREKAKLTLDPKQKEELTAKADEWRKKAMELRERLKGKPAAPAATAPAKTT